MVRNTASSLWSREVYQWLQTRKITQPRGPFCQFLLRLVKKAGKQSSTCTYFPWCNLELGNGVNKRSFRICSPPDACFCRISICCLGDRRNPEQLRWFYDEWEIHSAFRV